MATSEVTLGGRFLSPELVITHFHVHPGDVVADFGAGTGRFVSTLAERVGGEGRVYACDIQPQFVDAVARVASDRDLQNVYPTWSDISAPGGTKIPEGSVDALLLANTLFQCEDKEGVIGEAWRVLRSGGKLFLIDWNDSYGGLGPQRDEVVSPDDAIAYFEANGFLFEREFDAGDFHYGLAFRRV